MARGPAVASHKSLVLKEETRRGWLVEDGNSRPQDQNCRKGILWARPPNLRVGGSSKSWELLTRFWNLEKCSWCYQKEGYPIVPRAAWAPGGLRTGEEETLWRREVGERVRWSQGEARNCARPQPEEQRKRASGRLHWAGPFL